MELQIILLLAILLLPMLAQLYIMSRYNKYKRVELTNKITGQEVARKILDDHGLKKVHIVEVKGKLSDHYDPTRKVIRLSHDVFHGETVAAAAIAAHEVGHAIQDHKGYFFMKVRSFIFPVVRIATTFSYIVILIGLLAEMADLLYVGAALVGAGLVFQLVTLPVEFDASKRAREDLDKLGITTKGEAKGSSKVLTAAALTYVAGVIASAMQILRLILIARGRR